MRILVTGGAGFIGKHLCRRLVGEGHEVRSIDLRESTRMDSERHDVTSPWVWMRDLEDWIPSRIYLLACHASPERYQTDPIKTASTCFNGTRFPLNYAARHKSRVLLASTSEIYGEPLVHPQPESYRGNVNPIGPRACYDEGKRMAECLMMDYHRQHGVDTRIARIFNTYGPLMDFDDGRVISNFVTQALKGEPLTIYGDGSQTRSFCYIDDMVEGLIRLMEYEGEECHEPHNLGNPEENTIRHLAVDILDTIHDPDFEAALHYPTYINKVAIPLPIDDPTRRCPDITRAKRNLGWEPKVSLSEGLARTVVDFRERMKS